MFSSLFISCDDENRVLPAHTGRAGEVIVIMADRYWNGPAGEMVKETLQRPFPSLPQLEPTLSVIHADPKNVSYNYRTHRNVIIVDIEKNERNEEERGIQKESVWSNGQTVYTFHALDSEGFIEKFEELKESVISDIRKKDRIRLQRYMRNVEHPSISKRLQEKLGLGLTVHQAFELHKLEDDFAWMTREDVLYLSGVAHDAVQGIAIYTKPYVSDSLFEYDSMVRYRNEQLRDKVVSVYDSSMTVEMLLPPSFEQVDFKGQFAIEGRGLWRFPRPIMGGPFVSLTVVDEKNGRVITVDGYVFAPKFDKRNYILDIESIAYSLVF
ncbi:MAG: DUF4837 family protein [Flavobacteriales bacterium]|nr:DUF4837 family protein [Flavobacteriales bacterium]